MKAVRKRIVENHKKSDRKAVDQTDYLLSTPANRAMLSESIKQDKLGKVFKKGK